MGKGRVVPARAICDKLYNSGIRFISGKWFNGTTEIKNFTKYLYRIKGLEEFIQDSNDTRRVIDTFVEMYGESGWWPEMPLLKEAKEYTNIHKLCFPLCRKQLLIIKALLLGIDEVMIILCGVGGSGKSTFANIIKQLFDNDVSSLALSDLSNDFKMAQGANSRLIYADELNSDDLNNGIIKTLVSKQEVTINPKNERPYQSRWQGTMFFSCNTEPYIDLKDSGLIRRIVYYNMNEKIKNPDPTMQKKEYSHDDLVNIAAVALRTDNTNWKDEFKKETREILRRNNSVYICRDVHVPIKDYPYQYYKEQAMHKGLRTMSEPNFLNIRQVLGEWEDEEYVESVKDQLPF